LKISHADFQSLAFLMQQTLNLH